MYGVPALGEFFSQLGAHNAAAAVGRIDCDADIHERGKSMQRAWVGGNYSQSSVRSGERFHAEGVKFNSRGQRPRARIAHQFRPCKDRIRKDRQWPKLSSASWCI